MADSGKGSIGGTFEDIGEAVVKPVVDEVGKMVEIGAQSVGVPKANPDPRQNPGQNQPTSDIATKQVEEQQKIARWRFWLNRQKQLSNEQKRVRDETKQKETQRLQVETEEKKIKQFEIVKKEKKNQVLAQQQRKTEIRGGIGG